MTIHDAVRQADLPTVRVLIARDSQCVHERAERGWTPLHRVAAQGPDTRQAHALIAQALIAAVRGDVGSKTT